MTAQTQTPDLAQLYRAHVQDVGRWAERLAGPGFDVPDMVSEVFEIVQRRLPSFRGDSSLKTWLWGITEKVVRHRRRKDRLRHWLWPSTKDPTRHLAAAGPSQHERLEEKERHERVYQVLDRLAERDRRILILFELEELSGAEIAALLGISVDNVWLRMHRARARFLKVFQECEPEIVDETPGARGSAGGRCGHAG
jgi:RNA polymerase sigma-70 factor (ECF subfamily)